MSFLADLVKVAVNGAPGTGPITLGAAVSGFRSFSDAGVPNGARVGYSVEDGTNRETGYGTYNSAAGTLSRNLRASSTGALLNLSADAKVFIDASAAEFNNISSAGAATYNADGSVATITETIDGNNSVTTFTYNADGSVATAAEVYLGKTRTTTYTYNADGSYASEVTSES